MTRRSGKQRGILFPRFCARSVASPWREAVMPGATPGLNGGEASSPHDSGSTTVPQPWATALTSSVAV